MSAPTWVVMLAGVHCGRLLGAYSTLEAARQACEAGSLPESTGRVRMTPADGYHAFVVYDGAHEPPQQVAQYFSPSAHLYGSAHRPQDWRWEESA